MDKNIEKYVYKTSFISKDECTNVLNTLNKENNWREYPFDSAKDNICVKENPDIKYRDTKLQNSELNNHLNNKIENVVDEYINVFLKDMYWFPKWKGYGDFHFIHYPKNTGMGTHCDHVSNQFDGTRRGIPVLSVLGMLTDNFKGGKLLFWDETIIEFQAGEVLIFPSNFLYPHRVMPVLEGDRYSFIKWVW